MAGDAVLAPVEAVRRAEVAARADPRCAAGDVDRLDAGVLERAERRGHVARAAAARLEAQRDRPRGPDHVAAAGEAAVHRLPLQAQAAVHAVAERGRHLVTDHVDDAAQRVAAVEQGGRPAQHLDLRGGDCLDRYGVVGRGGREVADALAVLEDQDPVAAEPADHGARRRRSVRDRGEPGLPLQRSGDGHVEAAVQLLAAQHGRRPHRILAESRAQRAGHDEPRELDRRERQLHLELERITGGNCDLARLAPIADVLEDERVATGLESFQVERSVGVRQLDPVQLEHPDLHARERVAGAGVDDDAVHRARVRLHRRGRSHRPGRRSRGARRDCAQHHNEKQGETMNAVLKTCHSDPPVTRAGSRLRRCDHALVVGPGSNSMRG